MGAAAEDLMPDDAPDMNEKRRTEAKEPPKPGLSFTKQGANYQVDKTSSIRASAALKLENGQPKVKRIGIEYRKEF